MRKALVCGAGGFFGHHFVKMLWSAGFWLRGADLKYPEFSTDVSDEFTNGGLTACSGETVKTVYIPAFVVPNPRLKSWVTNAYFQNRSRFNDFLETVNLSY